MTNYRTTTIILFTVANISNIVITILQFRREKTDDRNKKFESISSIVTMITTMMVVSLASLI